MNNTTLSQQIRDLNKTVVFDFQNPQHREHFLSLYGGEAVVKEKLPALYQAFLEAVEKPMKMNAQIDPDDFNDGAEIEGITWKQEGNKLTVQAVTSLNNVALFIDEYLEIHTSAGESVDGYFQSSYNKQHSTLTLETYFDPRQYKSDILEIDYKSSWVDAKTGRLCTFMSSRNAHRELYLSSNVKAVHILAPVKKNERKIPPINIAYNRNFIPAEEIDYMYQDSFNPNTGRQWLYAPLSAWVEFNNNEDPFAYIDMSSFELKMDCKSGYAVYKKLNRKIPIQEHFITQPDKDEKYPNGFSFDLAAEWLDDVPAGRWPIRDRVDLYFTVKFYKKSGVEDTIQIGSNLIGELTPNMAKIDYLNLLWGCLAVGTHILMEDGSDKAIELINIGDRVICDAKGNIGKVVQLASGYEPKSMVHIQTLGGYELTCTQDHPILTTKGILKAIDVRGDCRLITPDGELGIIGIWDVEGGEIYNLVLASENEEDTPSNGLTMFAEHILVGDHNMQGAIAVRVNEPIVNNPHQVECAVKKAIWEEMK